MHHQSKLFKRLQDIFIKYLDIFNDFQEIILIFGQIFDNFIENLHGINSQSKRNLLGNQRFFFDKTKIPFFKAEHNGIFKENPGCWQVKNYPLLKTK